MSLGSRRVSSSVEATWQPIPPLKSLIDASSIRGSLPSMGAGSHAWGSGSWISAFSAPQLGAWLVLCCFDTLWASSSLEGQALPTSIASLPFGSFLLLGSTCSVLEGGGGWGAQGGDLGRGGGSLGWEGFPAEKASRVWECVPRVIIDEINALLSRKFEVHEVELALQQMAPFKAPGPNGMPSLFYQHFWETVSHDVTFSILMWLNSGTLPQSLNHTFISLIPKIKSPEYAHQFRPISLCNVLYKIFSKVLANYLKKVLPSIITEHQSAFTKDRLISNNIMVAFETLHCLQRYKSGSHGYMTVKLDMSRYMIG